MYRKRMNEYEIHTYNRVSWLCRTRFWIMAYSVDDAIKRFEEKYPKAEVLSVSGLR